MSNPSPETIRRAEEALATSLRRLRLYETVLSTTPDLVYIFGLDHRFLYANEALLKMWGKTWDEAIGLNCLELGYAPWHASMHDREIEQVVATKAPLQGVVPFTGTNGRVFTNIFLRLSSVWMAAWRLSPGTTRDVTDRQAMEAALRESEEFNRAILETARIA